MKVLSIQQPFASLIMLGHKKIETRSFATKIRGEILIHASLGKLYKKIPATDPFWQHYHHLFAENKIEAIEKLPAGAIIGKVELVTTSILCPPYKDNISHYGIYYNEHGASFTEQELAFGDYTPGRFGWLLANPIIFDKPISAKGQLGFWNYEL